MSRIEWAAHMDVGTEVYGGVAVRRFRKPWWHVGGRGRRWQVPVPRSMRWMALLLAVFYLGARLVDAIAAGPLDVAAENQARMLAIEAVNRVVMEKVAESRGDNLVSYRLDADGKVAALQVDAVAVNRIAFAAAQAASAELSRLKERRLSIPAGTLTGMRLLSHLGPGISVEVQPVGNVMVQIRQQFDAAGINQTRHLVYLETVARIRLLVPFLSREIEVTATMPLTETVLVGPVPNALYQGALGGVVVPDRP